MNFNYHIVFLCQGIQKVGQPS